jgi:pimeloyl-ACP methyl ester carboxylesterase
VLSVSSFSSLLRSTAIGAAFFVFAASAHSQSAAFDVWAKLGRGSYGCGFRNEWRQDYGHRYQTKLEDGSVFGVDKSPRPILMNVWYPASGGGTSMTLGDYYKIGSSGPELGRVPEALAKYALGVLTDEVFGHAEDKLTDAEKRLRGELLGSKTHARRGAAAAAGRFPIVIVHSGYGSSYADNIVMCEYLAQRGFIVVGSAYPRLDGASFNIEGKEGASYDIQFLIREAARIPEADWSHVGFVGHSGGAQAGMVYQSLDGNAIDATVCLDTTEDYYSMSDPRWDYMRSPVLPKKETMTRPMLIMAGPEAGFEFVDSLTSTPRWLFTVDETAHNDFVSDGVFQRWAEVRTAEEKDRARVRAESGVVWDRHAQICKVTGDFFDAKLRGQAAAFEERIRLNAIRGFVSDETHLESEPVGTSGPSLTVVRVPTPRQMRPLLKAEGASRVAERLKEARPTDPIMYTVYAFALTFQLAQDGKVEDGRILYNAYVAAKVDASQQFLGQGEMYQRFGRLDFARMCFKNLLALDPENEKAKKGLESIEAAAKAGGSAPK